MNDRAPPMKPTPAPEMPIAVVCAIKPMRLSDGRTDFFVSIKRGDREVTPHVFREEYKAAYHVALYNWLLNGTEEPDLLSFDEGDFPAQPVAASPAAAVVGEPVAWVDPVSLEILREENITTTNLLAHEQDGFVAVYLSAPDSRLRQALEFYRDEWEQDVDAELTHGGWTGSLGDLEPSDDLMKDKGEIARAALSAAHSSPDDDSPQELFARWLNDGPKLAKAAGVYVGVSVKPLPAPPALGGKP